MFPATVDRVSDHTPDRVNEMIREQTRESVAIHATLGPRATELRLEELDREWDIERTARGQCRDDRPDRAGARRAGRPSVPAVAGGRCGLPAPARRPGLVPAGAPFPLAGGPHGQRDRRGAIRPEGPARRLQGRAHRTVSTNPTRSTRPSRPCIAREGSVVTPPRTQAILPRAAPWTVDLLLAAAASLPSSDGTGTG